MRRDMDLIRRIALEVAELDAGQTLSELSDVPDDAFSQHAIWMEEAGLIRALISETLGDESPYVEVLRLTWDGCDFADEIRSDTLWRKAQGTVLKPATSFTFSILREWLKAEIAQGLPTLRGGA